MSTRNSVDPRVLQPIDKAKRSSIRKMVLGTAFVAPLMTSFSMDGLSINQANAYGGNTTTHF